MSRDIMVEWSWAGSRLRPANLLALGCLGVSAIYSERPLSNINIGHTILALRHNWVACTLYVYYAAIICILYLLDILYIYI